jgi:diguanylate cyclase (GGDEF)-like protein
VTAVLFIDLDRFKQVNDRYGHLCGDRLLVAVARRIRGTVRPFDTLGRLGGDELGIVCEVASPEDATRLAERIVDAVAEPFTIEGEVLRIGASVGVATASPATVTSERLIAEADSAMYRAKEAGGARWWMVGARDVEVESRRALAETNESLVDLGLEIDRLHERAERLRSQSAHLHDPILDERLVRILDSLASAKGLVGHHAVR